MEESNQLKVELTPLKFEMGHLKSALDAEIRSQKEYVQNMVQLGSAYEHAEHVTSGLSPRQAEPQTELEKTQADIEELKVNLIEKETELLGISEEMGDGLILVWVFGELHLAPFRRSIQVLI